MEDFVHLHVHTEYSLLDGAIRCKQLAENAAERGMRAIAMTDHGNMFGAITHYQACHRVGITPIIGCEVNVLREPTPGVGKAGDQLDHFVLIAENLEGYRNLLRVVSMGHLKPASELAPSVTLETLGEDTTGLIGMTGCMGGVLAQQVLMHGKSAGHDALDRLRSMFAPGSLFAELQDHGFAEQPVVNSIVVELAKALDVPLVATNDCHFLSKDDSEAQLYLSCIASNRAYSDALQTHHQSSEMYLKSAAEMHRRFRDVPAALSATTAIAERCQALKLKLDEPMLPKFEVPEGFDTASYLRRVAHDGLTERLAEKTRRGESFEEARFRERLDIELNIIISMNFPGYFLIVWDFIRYARSVSIPVGPGRGSGAGSLVAYSLRITDLDPLEHALLFERFLNPERVSMPDFDIDFCMDRRDEVIQYVADKYGQSSVGQIATFHELKARSVIKDVARAMGLAAPEAQRIANLIPAKGPGQMCTIDEALAMEPKLKATMGADPTIKELITQAQRLEGLTRHAGMHAAGVVISEGPLWEHVPCFSNNDNIVTQFAKDEVEAAGLVKFDFLGLKTLTVIDIAQRHINARPDRKDQPLDCNKLSFDDDLTYKLLQSGDTTGVFQLESSGMQQLFKDLRPDAFEDVVAAVALYRPGPLGTGMVKDFVDCKHGRKPITKMHDLVDELLKPTYGVIVYQEQVMQIAQRMAGYTLGGADVLRRAMGKKKPAEMAKQKEIFIEGALNNAVAKEDAVRIFELLEFFAGYGFNKSHSAAYALLTYQTAYLKAHYPVEFLCAQLTADRDKNDKVVRLIAEGRSWGIDILPPEVNASRTNFTVVYAADSPSSPNGKKPKTKDAKPKRKARFRDSLGPQVRFGLGAVRGVGDHAIDTLLKAREDGPFLDMFDVSQRVDISKFNRGVLEALVQCGALDLIHEHTDVSRAQAFASVNRAIERGKSATRDREAGQTNLFGLLAAAPGSDGGGRADSSDFAKSSPWDLRETLRREKLSLGFYVSGHPLDRYGVDLARFDVDETASLAARKPWSKVRVAGTVEGYRERVFRSGGKLAFFTLEDLSGGIEVKAREKQLTVCGELLKSGEPLLLSGKLQFPFSDDPDAGPAVPTLLLDEATPLSAAIREQTRGVGLRLMEAEVTETVLDDLRMVFERAPGRCRLQVQITLDDGAEAVFKVPGYRVDPSNEFLSGLERLFGRSVTTLR